MAFGEPKFEIRDSITSNPKIMGILNVTPDSFYDGGRYAGGDGALAQLERLVAEGAQIVDIGGESSRPGSPRISLEEELLRVGPALRRLRSERGRWDGVGFSIDTMKAPVARLAVECGAVMVNDISALRHDEAAMTQLLRERPDVRVVLMHMKGDPLTMQQNPDYGDVVEEVAFFFEERLERLEQLGIERGRAILDPGIGFGKRLEHNLELLRRLGEFKSRFGLEILAGASRKSFIGMIAQGAQAPERLGGSLAAALCCAARGVDYLRVHDVGETRQALEVWQAISA